MANSIVVHLKGGFGQTFRTLQEVRTAGAQCARYASAMGHYTPSHRARHQMLAWHAATKQAEKMGEAADALDEVAAASKSAIDNANFKATLYKSGSAAATNLPFTNGVSQKREFSTMRVLLKGKNAKAGRVSSDETMSSDTTFATSSSTTHTTSGSGSTPKPRKSTSSIFSRLYSSKPEPTPYEKHLTDEEHRLQESLIKANNLMNQDEGMNPNEDKEGMRIHQVSTHHKHNHNRHQKKHASAGLGSGLGSGSASASPVPGESPAGKPLASAANPGGGVGATRSYATKAKPKAMKEGVDNLKGEMVNHKKPKKSTSSTTSGSASVAATNPGESPAGTPAASAAHIGGGVGATRAYATSAKGKKKTVGEAILENKGNFVNLINTKELNVEKKTSPSVAASNPGESPAGNPAASASHPGGGVGASRAYSTTAKSTKAKRQEAERHKPEIVSSEGQFLNTNEVKETHEYPPLVPKGLNPLPEEKGVKAGREEAGEDRLRKVDGLDGDKGRVKVVGSPNHPHHKGHHKKPPTSTAATKRSNYPTSSTRSYATASTGLSEKNNMKSGSEESGNARAREVAKIVDRDAESPNRVHHKNQHKKAHSASADVKRRNYSTSSKPKSQAPKEHIDEVRDDRLQDKNAINVESYEYTRSGTDNEVAADPEAYSREHVHPEDELREEETNKKVYMRAVVHFLIEETMAREAEAREEAKRLYQRGEGLKSERSKLIVSLGLLCCVLTLRAGSIY